MTQDEVPVAVDPLLAEVEAVEAGRPESAPVEPDGAACALRAIAVAVGSVPGEDQLPVEARLTLIAHLDDDARQVLSAPQSATDAPGAEMEVVAAARDVFGALLDAYQACIEAIAGGGVDDKLRQELNVRLVSAGAQRIKWERCAGGPMHPNLWRWIGSCLAQVDAGGLPGAPGSDDRADRLDTTVEREYVRAVAYYCAALEHLSLPMLAVVDRVVALVLPMLQFQPVVAPGAVAGAFYYLAPDFSAAPRRGLAAAEQRDGAWYLSTRAAVEALHELALQLQRGTIPPGFEEDDAGGERLAGALVHLVRNWSEASPVRRYRRHLLGGKLTAVRGIRDLCQLFAGESVSQLGEWEFRDASRGGIGAFVPSGPGEPAVGELVGILPHDGEVWQLGVVRRTWRESGDAMRVGLEALSQRPILASVDDGLVRTEVFVCDPLSRGEAVRLAAPANTLRAGVPVFLTANGSIQKLKPLDASLSGDGFELRVYQVL